MSAILNYLYTFVNQIVYAISNFRILDIIDIVVMALIIYKAIQFLKQTRAGQLVKGIAILIFAYLIARWFELAVLRWLLTIIMDSAIVAIAIIFQPEIRRILERVGQMRLGHGQAFDGDESELADSINQICKAAGIMSEQKIGALIVFERKTQLGEIINTGTVINAKASVSMVNSVFFPNSPLHDGALIVRDGRLYAAGCILPLTQSQIFSSQLGTRHKAAIGMTENSDSVVLIVSEETGIISISFDGQIQRNFNVASAQDYLMSKLIDKNEADGKNAIVSNIRSFLLKPSKKKEEGEVDNEKED